MMRPFTYIAVSLFMIVVVAVLNKNETVLEEAPLAMVALAEKLSLCSASKGIYRGLGFTCDTPISFADVRKLDMRSDNRLRSRSKIAKFVVP
jgi:hypothetical protein